MEGIVQPSSSILQAEPLGQWLKISQSLGRCVGKSIQALRHLISQAGWNGCNLLSCRGGTITVALLFQGS